MNKNTYTTSTPSHSLALSFKEWNEVDLQIILRLRITNICTVLEYVFVSVCVLRTCYGKID